MKELCFWNNQNAELNKIQMENPYLKCSEQIILSPLRIGHTRLTHEFFMVKGE